MDVSSAKATGKTKESQEKLMFQYSAGKLAKRLVHKNIIENDNYDIYQYGINQLMVAVLNSATIVILGIILGALWQSVLFLIVFMVSRSYAGGYHASTPIRCYLLTTLVITAVLSVMQYIRIGIYVCFGLLILSSLFILLLSPVESENKPLDSIEKMIYRKKTIIIWCIETIIIIVLIVFKYNKTSMCIIMAQFTLSISLVCGVIKNKILGGKNNGKQN